MAVMIETPRRLERRPVSEMRGPLRRRSRYALIGEVITSGIVLCRLAELQTITLFSVQQFENRIIHTRTYSHVCSTEKHFIAREKWHSALIY